MWSATDMEGSGADREVTRGTTEATLWTSSEWELSQDLGKLSEALLADADAALNPGDIYREPKDTHDTVDTKPPTPKTAEPEETTTKETAEATRRPTKTPTADATKTPTAGAKKTPTTDATKTPTADATKTPTAGATKTPTAGATKTPTTDATKTPTAEDAKTSKADARKTPTADATKLLPLTINPEASNPMWSATDIWGEAAPTVK
jgi:hypothetical protein